MLVDSPSECHDYGMAGTSTRQIIQGICIDLILVAAVATMNNAPTVLLSAGLFGLGLLWGLSRTRFSWVLDWPRSSSVVTKELAPRSYCVDHETLLLPNCPINELFLHIDGSVLNGDGKWETVGRNIRDLAANEALVVWGRQFRKRGVPDDLLAMEKDNALQVVRPDYWGSADFSYFFFSDEGQFRIHTFPNDRIDGTCYSDLHVNKEQAFTIWSNREREVESDTSFHAVVVCLFLALIVSIGVVAWPPKYFYDKSVDAAYGMLAIKNLAIDKIGQDIGVRMVMENASTVHALRVVPQSAFVTINGHKYAAERIDEIPVIPPRQSATLRFPFFPISRLKGTGTEEMTVGFKFQYGHAGVDAPNAMCEIEHCSFTFNPPNRIGNTRCEVEICG